MLESQVVTFTVVAAMLTVSPGPVTMLAVPNVLRGSRRNGIATACGICLWLFVHGVLSVLGLSVILLHAATAFYLVKLAGACYLVWIWGFNRCGEPFKVSLRSQIQRRVRPQRSSASRIVSWKAF